jgi:hypothetical protein
MTESNHDYRKFQYFVEDCECSYCINNAKKSETDGRGCKLISCAFADIRNEAQSQGRIIRDKGWNKHNINDNTFKPDSYTTN